jgi:hypothetical protein
MDGYLSVHPLHLLSKEVGRDRRRVGLYVGMKASDTQTDTIVFIVWIFS